MKNQRYNFFLDAIALFFGLILPLAFAPYEIFPLAILSPAILILTCIQATTKRAFWRGFLFGLGYFGTGVYWVYISVYNFGGVVMPLAILITGGLIVALAIFPALATYFTTKLNISPKLKALTAFPAIWVLLEWVRSWFLTGFPWLLLGSSQTNSPLKGYAAILSVYGVSLAVVVTSGLVATLIMAIRRGNYFHTYLSIFVMIAIWSVGAGFSYINWTHPVGKPIAVSLVQGDIPQALKWSPEHLQLSLDVYRQLTEPLLEKSPQIIIWPEAAIPLPLQDAQDYINELDALATKHQVSLILGIPVQSENGRDYYNTIVSLGKDKRYYVKRHLVPFGEYTPFEKYLSTLLSFMDIPMSNLLPGKPEQEPFIINGFKILTNICYEIAFPEEIRTKDDKIAFILTLTNDAWFGKSAASAQHLQMAQMRALELGRAVLMVGNDGITAIVSPHGMIQAAAPQRQTYILTSEVQAMQGSTPWMYVGIDPLLILALTMLFISVRSAVKNRLLQHNVADTPIHAKPLNTSEDHTSIT